MPETKSVRRSRRRLGYAASTDEMPERTVYTRDGRPMNPARDRGAPGLSLAAQLGAAPREALEGRGDTDPLAAPESIIYDVLDLEGDIITVTIDVAGDGTSWWTYRLARE